MWRSWTSAATAVAAITTNVAPAKIVLHNSRDIRRRVLDVFVYDRQMRRAFRVRAVRVLRLPHHRARRDVFEVVVHLGPANAANDSDHRRQLSPYDDALARGDVHERRLAHAAEL